MRPPGAISEAIPILGIAPWQPLVHDHLVVQSIFVNIPTGDLERSKAFYTALGADINPLFTDDNAAAVVWNDTVYFMVLHRDYLQTFTEKPIVDPATHAQTLIALSLDSRDAVDRMLAAGITAGGTEPKPATDHGFMYTRDLEDPDGNILEFFWMDPAAVEQGPSDPE